MHSPLVPVPVLLNSQGHFLNILLSEKENILSLVLSLGHIEYFIEMSLYFYISRTYRINTPLSLGTYRIMSFDVSIDMSFDVSLSLFIYI